MTGTMDDTDDNINNIDIFIICQPQLDLQYAYDCN